LEKFNEKRVITIAQIVSVLFFLGLFFIPFTSFIGLPALGEYKKEASIFFFFPACLILLATTLFTKVIYIPRKNPLFILLLVIAGWFLVATLLNINNVVNYYFKFTTGIERFIRQYAVIIISIVLLLTFYNSIKRYSNINLFYKVRTVFLCSLFVVTAYAVLEILVIKFHLGFIKPILELFDYFPFTEVHLDPFELRISSVTHEPPALATYLLMVSGWMFSYIITNKGLLRFIPSIVVLCLALFSGSRAGLVIIVVQIVVFFFFLVKKKKYHQLLIKIAIGALFLGTIVGVAKGKEIATYIQEKISSFSVNDDKHSISNKSRFGIQHALYEVFLDNPISGVGFGQQTFEAVKKLPPWATANNWEFKYKYLNPDHPSFIPGYNVFARLLAETGIIGVLLFTVWIAFIIYSCFILAKRQNTDSIFAIVLFISMIGFLMNWLKMDTFRVIGFWVTFAFLLKLTHNTSFKIAKK